jgi:hypothetical protein
MTRPAPMAADCRVNVTALLVIGSILWLGRSFFPFAARWALLKGPGRAHRGPSGSFGGVPRCCSQRIASSSP